MEFKLGNTRIKTEFWFFFTVAIFLISDRTGLGAGGIFSILLHEAAHIVVMKLCGVKLSGITFRAFGVAIEENGLGRLSVPKECAVYLAGPLVNLFVAAGAIILMPRSYLRDGFAAINAVMGVFNLLPVACLDGGNVVKAVAGRLLRPNRAAAVAKLLNAVFLLPMCAYGIYIAVGSRGNFTLALTCGYLAVRALGD